MSASDDVWERGVRLPDNRPSTVKHHERSNESSKQPHNSSKSTEEPKIAAIKRSVWAPPVAVPPAKPLPSTNKATTDNKNPKSKNGTSSEVKPIRKQQSPWAQLPKQKSVPIAMEKTSSSRNPQSSNSSAAHVSRSSSKQEYPWGSQPKIMARPSKISKPAEPQSKLSFDAPVYNPSTGTAPSTTKNVASKKKNPTASSSLSNGETMPKAAQPKRKTKLNKTEGAKSKSKVLDSEFPSLSAAPVKTNASVALEWGKKAPSPSKQKTTIASQRSGAKVASAQKVHTSDFPSLSNGSGITNSSARPAKKSLQQQKKATNDVAIPKRGNADNHKKKEKIRNKTGKVHLGRRSNDQAQVMDEHHGGLNGGFFANADIYNAKNLVGGKLGGVFAKKGGRQRVGPQKKKFSSLKKKVLEERLRKWKESQAADGAAADVTSNESLVTYQTVCLYGYCTHEELLDDDEYEEIIENLDVMARKIGPVKQVCIPRSLSDGRDNDDWPAFVEFDDYLATSLDHDASKDILSSEKDQHAHTIAAAAMDCWDGLLLGGEKIRCQPLHLPPSSVQISNEAESSPSSSSDWENRCIQAEQVLRQVSAADTTGKVNETHSVMLFDALTEDDLEDEECMEESIADITRMMKKHGRVDSIVPDHNNVKISFSQTSLVDAMEIAANLSKLVVGGTQLKAEVINDGVLSSGNGEVSSSQYTVHLHNVLTEEDIEDQDCLDESLNDIRELAGAVGTVINISADELLHATNSNENDPALTSVVTSVSVQFSCAEEATKAVSHFNGMMVGGLTVCAVLKSDSIQQDPSSSPTSKKKSMINETGPMYSGDKIISERFAACKRVPKILNAKPTREYATLSTDETIKPLLTEMLGELMRLQRRAMEENKNTKMRRRIVMGLREVARGIRSHKVKMVVMASNLDEYGVIDEKLQEIIATAAAEGVPVFYDFTKRTLGKALHKSIKIAVVGVQNAEGAHQPFKKLMSLAVKYGI